MLIQTLATLVLCYLALCALVFFNQRDLVFPVPPGTLEPSLSGAELLRIPGAEGRTVYALHVHAKPDAPTVVHFHGNGELPTGPSPLPRP